MCNQKFRQLADEAAASLEEAGAKPFVFHPPVISDGQTMGSTGMRYCLSVVLVVLLSLTLNTATLL